MQTSIPPRASAQSRRSTPGLVLFHDTIMANVSLGDPSFTRADAERALRQAGAWDFVSQLGEGAEHVVGERGAVLSGGQRHRIALARALIHKPRLLILDEATSALDPATEAEIVRNVRELADREVSPWFPSRISRPGWQWRTRWYSWRAGGRAG